MRKVYHCLRSAVDDYLPRVCLLCHELIKEASPGICTACMDLLPPHHGGCQICGCPLVKTASTRCGACMVNPPAYDHVYALYTYQAPVSQLIYRMKYGHDFACLHAIGELMADKGQCSRHFSAYSDDWAFLAVPLHRRRLSQRGFNQSLELAKHLAKVSQMPLLQKGCDRVRETPSQTGLTAKQRKKNVAQAFSINIRPPAHVVLVDDVMTTGATVDALAAAIKRAGAQRVSVFVFARAHLDYFGS